MFGASWEGIIRANIYIFHIDEANEDKIDDLSKLDIN